MTSNRSLPELTREELYELVWSTPLTALATYFGVESETLAKRCRKLDIPRPGSREWEYVARGHVFHKQPLPPAPATVFEDAKKELLRGPSRFSKRADKTHELAALLMQELGAAKTDEWSHCVSTSNSRLPSVCVSKQLVPEAVHAFDMIVKSVEAFGVKYGRGRNSHGWFMKGSNRLEFCIKEELVERPGRIEVRGFVGRSWAEVKSRVPCGHLTLSLEATRCSNAEAKCWKSDEQPLKNLVTKAIQEIRRYFVEATSNRLERIAEAESNRIEFEARQERMREQIALQKKEEQARLHSAAIKDVIRCRRTDLSRAAEWWRLYELTLEFIAECEKRWLERNGTLSTKQEKWLEWARTQAKHQSPFEAGYPDPDDDGQFDSAVVPIGGPYPKTRNFSPPPTMPESPQPQVIPPTNEELLGSTQQPYPFWLRNSRRY